MASPSAASVMAWLRDGEVVSATPSAAARPIPLPGLHASARHHAACLAIEKDFAVRHDHTIASVPTAIVGCSSLGQTRRGAFLGHDDAVAPVARRHPYGMRFHM